MSPCLELCSDSILNNCLIQIQELDVLWLLTKYIENDIVNIVHCVAIVMILQQHLMFTLLSTGLFHCYKPQPFYDRAVDIHLSLAIPFVHVCLWAEESLV